MTEAEYLALTNLQKISCATSILSDVLPGDGWGISKAEYSALMRLINPIRDRMFELKLIEE